MNLNINKDSFPTRKELISVLEQLIEGKLDRHFVADWAEKYDSDDSYYIEDKKVEEALYSLSMVDLPSTDREYLYTQTDFHLWIKELEIV